MVLLTEKSWHFSCKLISFDLIHFSFLSVILFFIKNFNTIFLIYKAIPIPTPFSPPATRTSPPHTLIHFSERVRLTYHGEATMSVNSLAGTTKALLPISRLIKVCFQKECST